MFARLAGLLDWEILNIHISLLCDAGHLGGSFDVLGFQEGTLSGWMYIHVGTRDKDGCTNVWGLISLLLL